MGAAPSLRQHNVLLEACRPLCDHAHPRDAAMVVEVCPDWTTTDESQAAVEAAAFTSLGLPGPPPGVREPPGTAAAAPPAGLAQFRRTISWGEAVVAGGEQEAKAGAQPVHGWAPPPVIARAGSIELDTLPLCPKVGCSFAFLEQFAREGGRAGSARLQRMAEVRTSRTSVASPAHAAAGFTMGAVCTDIIKPQTISARAPTQLALEPPDPTGSYKLEEDEEQERQEEEEEEEEEEGERLSYAELALRGGMLDSRGQPAFAKATHFVSHAWRYEFTSFVEALRNWLEHSGTPEDDTYFWVDAFVVNQHKAQDYPQAWWSTRFMEAVGEIGNTILVLEPWHDPVPFTRAWVVWELYCTLVTGARLHLTMRPQEMANFNETLVSSFEDVQTRLSNVDVSKSQAFHEADQRMIHGEISRTIGFVKLNEMVQTRLLQWLLEAARNRLAAMRAEMRTEIVEEPKKLLADRFKLQSNSACLLRESGDLGAAERCFRELLSGVQRAYGGDHASTLSCVNQLAVTLQKAGNIGEASRLHRHCLRRRTRLLGPQHADSLQSASNLAVLLSLQRPLTARAFTEARKLFQQAIRGREQTLGAQDVGTLYSVSGLGRLLSEAPPGVASARLFEEAEALHERAARGLSRELHEAHPLALTALHAQAAHWLARRDFVGQAQADGGLRPVREIMEQLRAVHASRTEKLGKQHPDTMLTEHALQQCVLRMRRLRRQATGQCYDSWAALSIEVYSELCTRAHFQDARARLRQYGAVLVLAELEGRGIVDPGTKLLTTGMTPYNVFARIASGVMDQPSMAQEQARLGRFQEQFIIACNRRECDEMWESSAPAWVGKASMSKNHKMLILKGLHWQWFNVLTFGVAAGLEAALAKLKDMREAARLWVEAQEDWPPMERVGLFVHVYAHCSVNSFHLHIVDMDHRGPTFGQLAFKNLRLDDAISVLEEEVSLELEPEEEEEE